MRLLFTLFIAFFLFSCKKLDSEKIFLQSACEECKITVEDYIKAIKGVYYVNFDVENEYIEFHFDKKDAALEVETWLINNGMIKENDSINHSPPFCCTNINDTILQ